MKDGEDHINIYSKGETPLGRYLSNFAHTPFEHPFDGKFDSIEGYWYWQLTGDDELRKMSGYEAKKRGQEQLSEWTEYSEWDVNKPSIKIAILSKLMKNSDFLKDFIESKLPFRHYYKYGNKTVEPKQGKWIVEFFEDLRKILK